RNVHPKVVMRLRALGLGVREVKEGGTQADLQGTGFVISTNGHVVTCAHVIGNTNTATLWINGSRFEADVINADTNLDLALLKMRAAGKQPPRPLSMATSDAVKLGYTVLTMGFPLSDF